MCPGQPGYGSSHYPPGLNARHSASLVPMASGGTMKGMTLGHGHMGPMMRRHAPYAIPYGMTKRQMNYQPNGTHHMEVSGICFSKA